MMSSPKIISLALGAPHAKIVTSRAAPAIIRPTKANKLPTVYCPSEIKIIRDKTKIATDITKFTMLSVFSNARYSLVSGGKVVDLLVA